MEASKEQIEVAAKAIYNLWHESNQYPWQEGGNSDKQYLARKYAEAALASARVPNAWEEAVKDACTVAGEMGWKEDDPRGSLRALIDFHVQIATDPAVNGGLSLQPVAARVPVAPEDNRAAFIVDFRKRHSVPDFVPDNTIWTGMQAQAEFVGWQARAALASQAAPIYQIGTDNVVPMYWGDVPREEYDASCGVRRIVYTAPQPAPAPQDKTVQQDRADFECWYLERSKENKISSDDCARQWSAWLARSSGHYHAPSDWKLSPQPWGRVTAPAPAVAVDSTRSREQLMKDWDSWRAYIAGGGGASWPRDAFECLLDELDELRALADQPAQAPADRIALPQNADQAAGMVLIGTRYLEQNAPERLRQAPAGEPVAYKEVGSFLYVGAEYVATSSDDPRGVKLYRAAPVANAGQAQPTPKVITQDSAKAQMEEWLWWFVELAGNFPSVSPDDRIWGHVLAYMPHHVPLPDFFLARLPQAAQLAGDERAAFETDYRKRHQVPESMDFRMLAKAPDAWDGWQARAAIAAQPQLQLSDEEIEFVGLVHCMNGAKIASPCAYASDGEPLWAKPESLGLIEAVGSYKWKVVYGSFKKLVMSIAAQQPAQHATQAQADDVMKVLADLLKHAEGMEVAVDGECGHGRTLQQLEDAGLLPAEIIAARAAIAAQKGGV